MGTEVFSGNGSVVVGKSQHTVFHKKNIFTPLNIINRTTLLVDELYQAPLREGSASKACNLASPTGLLRRPFRSDSNLHGCTSYLLFYENSVLLFIHASNSSPSTIFLQRHSPVVPSYFSACFRMISVILLSSRVNTFVFSNLTWKIT